jgi:hypothetical protein
VIAVYRSLKAKLTLIKENAYLLSDQGYDAFMGRHLPLLGHPDPTIRDDLIYQIFENWISTGRVSREALRNTLGLLTSADYLFYKMRTAYVKHSLKRTFSLLVVASILELDNRTAFISSTEYEEVHQRMDEYIHAERVTVSYIPRYGWSHSTAHAADVLRELFRSNKSTTSHKDHISELVVALLTKHTSVFQDKEEQRLRSVFLNESCPVDEEFITDHFARVVAVEKPPDYYQKLVQDRNILLYVQALYFYAVRYNLPRIASMCTEYILDAMHLR